MKRIVVPDVVRRAWSQARGNLSENWRRDAAELRKKAIQAERRVAKSLHKSWVRLKPKVVQVEHKLHEAWLTNLRKIRDAA